MHSEPTEIEDEDEKAKFMKIKKAKDPFEKRLKPILDDKRKHVFRGAWSNPLAPPGLPASWNIRHYGDQTFYPTNTRKKTPTCHGCSFLESLIWPGWRMAIHVGPLLSGAFNILLERSLFQRLRWVWHEVLQCPPLPNLGA